MTTKSFIPPKGIGSAPDYNNCLLVLQDREDELTEGGIIIPDTAQEKPQRGIVIAMGTRSDDKQTNIKPGDKILFGQHAGIEIKLKGIEYLLMRYADILWKL